MSASPPDPDRLEEGPENAGDERLSGKAASDPDEAQAAAEEALAQIEALADLDDASGTQEQESASGQTEASAEAAPEPSAPNKPDTPEDQCENCGALLHGPYCSECGQRSADRVVPLWHMLNEALEAVVQLDVRVLHTLPTFLFLPGRLTKEYIEGRRKRYIRPFRLYLFATFLLFTVLAVTTGQGFQFSVASQSAVPPADSGRAAAPVRGDDTTAVAPAPSFLGSADQRERWAQNLETNPESVKFAVGSPEMQAKVERILRAKGAEALRNPRDVLGSMIDHGPYVMFLMLPLFALLNKLLYIRRSRLYVEHLIFSLHVHAFAFVAFTVAILLESTGGAALSTAAGWVEASPLLYLVLAMAHVYDQGLLKSTIKAFLLLLVYALLLVLGLMLLFFAAIVLL
jgi:hypothetical protein